MLRVRHTHGGGYVHYSSATRRAVPPAAHWASKNVLSFKAAEPPAFASWSSLGNIAHAARFGRNETLIAGLKLEAPARDAVVQLRLDAMPLVATLAVGAIGRQHVAAQGLFAYCESLVRMSRDTASMAECSYTPRSAAWERKYFLVIHLLIPHRQLLDTIVKRS